LQDFSVRSMVDDSVPMAGHRSAGLARAAHVVPIDRRVSGPQAPEESGSLAKVLPFEQPRGKRVAAARDRGLTRRGVPAAVRPPLSRVRAAGPARRPAVGTAAIASLDVGPSSKSPDRIDSYALERPRIDSLVARLPDPLAPARWAFVGALALILAAVASGQA
jgi:hypothetical protein